MTRRRFRTGSLGSQYRTKRKSRPTVTSRRDEAKQEPRVPKTTSYNVQDIQSYAPGGILNYTSWEFRTGLKREALDVLRNTKTNVVPSAIRSLYNPLDATITLRSETEETAEHEAIHALHQSGDTAAERIINSLKPTFYSQLNPTQQQGILTTYNRPNWSRFGFQREREAPAVLWQQVREFPKQISLYTAAIPFFEQYFLPEFIGLGE